MLSPLLFAAALALSGDGDLVEDFEGSGSAGWERVASDAHPPYNSVERVRDPGSARSGSQFLRMQTLGGSTALRQSATRSWPVGSGRPYQASVWTRLSGTRRDAAFLSLTWVNAAGESLGETRSAALSKAPEWTMLSVDIAASPAGAASVRVALNLDGDDVRGTGDFDLLRLVGVERLEVRPAGRPFPLYSHEEYPRFTVMPVGLPPGVHAVTGALRTSDGKEIVRTATVTLPSDRPAVLDFPPVPPGAHALTVSIDGRSASRSLAVLVPRPGELLNLEDYGRTSTASTEPLETTLQQRLLAPDHTTALDSRFLDADGFPTAGFYALRTIDRFLERAEPLADPGLFSATLRSATFRKGDDAALAVWSDSGEVEIPVDLNEGARVMPALGPERRLRPGEKIRVGAMPTLILGVDPLRVDLILTLSSAELPLQLGPSKLTLRLRNASRTDTPRDVSLSLDVPPGWRVLPRNLAAPALAPQEVLSGEFEWMLLPTESERLQELGIVLRYVVRGREQRVRLTRSLRLASAIGLESSMENKGLTLRLLNGTDRAMTLSLRARIPGLAEQTALVRDLVPGGSRVFDYPAKDAGAAEVYVQEAGGSRSYLRRSVPLR